MNVQLLGSTCMWRCAVLRYLLIYSPYWSGCLKMHTHGVVSENVVLVSGVWSCRSELCGSGGSRCRSWRRNESTGAC